MGKTLPGFLALQGNRSGLIFNPDAARTFTRTCQNSHTPHSEVTPIHIKALRSCSRMNTTTHHTAVGTVHATPSRTYQIIHELEEQPGLAVTGSQEKPAPSAQPPAERAAQRKGHRRLEGEPCTGGSCRREAQEEGAPGACRQAGRHFPGERGGGLGQARNGSAPTASCSAAPPARSWRALLSPPRRTKRPATDAALAARPGREAQEEAQPRQQPVQRATPDVSGTGRVSPERHCQLITHVSRRGGEKGFLKGHARGGPAPAEEATTLGSLVQAGAGAGRFVFLRSPTAFSH